jgi:Cft2 family RNA processing exonuclease
MIEYRDGIHIQGTDFWLDAKRNVDFSFISHAHADHAIRHKEILSTKETARLCEHRLGKTKFNILGYDQPQRLRRNSKSDCGIKVELFPSGHVLGGAQILLEIEGVKIVYTGDFKLRRPLTAKRAEVKRCDILIMESTFGLPRYVFPPQKEIGEKITEFVDQALSSGEVPILLAYSLGKAQEIMKMLGNRGYKLSVHGAILNLARIYEELGVKFKNFRPCRAGDLEERVLIVPPQVRGSAMIRNIPRKRTAVLTGWAVDSGIRNLYGVDDAFPLSDHADFSELTEYARLAEPKKIYTMHGFPEFPGFLRKEGFDAEQLKENTKVGRTLSKEVLLNYDLFVQN